jgi:hypothetical protein
VCFGGAQGGCVKWDSGAGDEERGKFDIMGLALGAGRGRGRWGFW